MPDSTNSQYPTQSEIDRAKAQAVGGKRDRCIKGKSCSAACITSGYMCLVELPSSTHSEIAKIRDVLKKEEEASKVKQPSLFKVSDYLTKEGVEKAKDKFKADIEPRLYEAIQKGSAGKDEYNKIRQEVADFNKKMVKSGMSDKADLVKMPVEWDRVRKVHKAYERALDDLNTKAENAAVLGDRDGYNKIEKRIIALENKLGSRLGDYDKTVRGKIWNEMDGDRQEGNEFLRGIMGSPALKGARIIPDHDGYGEIREITIDKRVGKHKVSLHLEDHGTSFSFQIDDSYRKPEGMSNKTGLQIANATEEMFSAVVGNMEIGSVVSVYPYDGDGRGSKRRRAYERFGFGSVRGDETMYGEVSYEGLTPSNYRALSEYRGEGMYNFAESKASRVKAMYVALWGEEPTK